jgi:ribosomal protein S18 acetylase RimI-like enzyme
MIRHAEPSDAEEIHDVALKSWKDTYSHILSEEAIKEVIEDWYSVKELQEQTEHPIFYIAEESDEVVGFVHATVGDGKATLHRIYLDPKYQGKGIGSKLYEKAENDIRQKADKIELEVLAENKKGNSFYQKQGFKKQETEEVELKGEKAKQKILVKSL